MVAVNQIAFWLFWVSVGGIGVAQTLPAPITIPFVAQTPLVSRKPVPIRAFLDTLSVGQEGYAQFVPRTVTISGRRYTEALITEVSDRRPGEQISGLVIPLEGEFYRFTATVGRDEREAANGLGYVYFEVWGDEKLLTRSAPLGANRSPGGFRSGEQFALRVPQELDISVQGVQELRLLTRYASELPQRGGRLESGKGCVWGDARLTPLPNRLTDAPSDPVRDALRTASARLTAALLRTEKGQNLPQKVAVAPLRRLASENRRDGREGEVQAALSELFVGTRQGNTAIFRSVGRSEVRRFAEAFRSDRPEADETGGLIEVGRKNGADIVVTGNYTWTRTATGQRGGKVVLYAVVVGTGRRLEPVEVAFGATPETSAPIAVSKPTEAGTP